MTLGELAQDAGLEASFGCIAVDALASRNEPDAGRVKHQEQLPDETSVATEPVERNYDHDVDLSPGDCEFGSAAYGVHLKLSASAPGVGGGNDHGSR